MNELLTKAAQTADLLHDDLREAVKMTNGRHRPEGMSREDRALSLVLGRMLTALEAVRSDLMMLQ